MELGGGKDQQCPAPGFFFETGRKQGSRKFRGSQTGRDWNSEKFQGSQNGRN